MQQQLVTQAEFARILGRAQNREKAPSRQYINKLVNEGTIPLEGGKIDAAKALRILAERADPARELAALNRQAEGEEAPRAGWPDPPVGKDEASAEYRKQRAEREAVVTERERFNLDREKKLYVLKADVYDDMHAAGRKIRQKLDLITRWADEIASTLGVAGQDVKQLLKPKIRDLQQEIADALRLGDDDGEGTGAGDGA